MSNLFPSTTNPYVLYKYISTMGIPSLRFIRHQSILASPLFTVKGLQISRCWKNVTVYKKENGTREKKFWCWKFRSPGRLRRTAQNSVIFYNMYRLILSSLDHFHGSQKLAEYLSFILMREKKIKYIYIQRNCIIHYNIVSIRNLLNLYLSTEAWSTLYNRLDYIK